MVDLRNEVARALGLQALPEAPPAYEPQSNGGVENAVKQLKGLIRTLMLALQARIQGEVPVDHPLMLWLVEHAAELLTKHLVGHDGRTAFERLFGEACREDGYEFGESVHYKLKPTETGRSLSARWETGTWLGRRWGTGSHIVAGGPGEVREVRTVARRPLSERWSRETLQELRAVPWAWRMAPPAAGEVPQVIPHVAVEAEAPALPRGSAVLAPRRVQITQRLMEEHGYTAGCPRCSRVRANRTTAGSRHSEECRARFEAVLRAAGDANIERADARINEHLAEQVRLHAEASAGPREDSGGQSIPAPPPGDAEAVASPSTPVAVGRADPSDAEDEDPFHLFGEPVMLDDSMDDVDEEMMYLQNAVGARLDGRGEREEATDLIRALFAAGAAPGEVRASVTEVDSQPRVTAAAALRPHLGVLPAGAFDLRAGPGEQSWDFTRSDHRVRAMKLITAAKPYLIIGSPPCTDWCRMNVNLNHPRMEKAVVEERLRVARVHLMYVIMLY